MIASDLASSTLAAAPQCLCLWLYPCTSPCMCLRRLVPPKHHGHHRHPRLRHKDAHRHRRTHGTVVQSLMSMLILIRTPVQLPMQILLFMLMRVTSFMLEFLQILPQIPVHRMLVVPMAFCLCSRLCRCTSLYPRLWCFWFLRCFCYILVLAVPMALLPMPMLAAIPLSRVRGLCRLSALVLESALDLALG